MKKIIILLIFTITVILSLSPILISRAYPATLSVGLSTWYLQWDIELVDKEEGEEDNDTGKIQMENSVVLGIDEEELIKQCQKHAEGVWARVG